MDFKFITHDCVNPQFNIASEEYLLKYTDGYYVYLWRNSPAVIVGVNQNAFEEVNLEYVNQNDVAVVRRMTGGGAVYHDLNNICYTVIAPFDSQADNYRVFTLPVIKYLNSLGVKAEFSGRNDITVDGKKISGNAQTVYNGKIMHHGTILFNSDLSAVSNALKPNQLKMKSKGIKSVRARVTNVCESLPSKISVEEFFLGLKKALSKGLEKMSFSNDDLQKINLLVKEKYSKFEWNMGHSPKGDNTFSQKFDFGVFTFNFSLNSGKIENPVITGDFFSLKPIEDFAKTLVGLTFDYNCLSSAFCQVGEYIQGADGVEIAKRLFS